MLKNRTFGGFIGLLVIVLGVVALALYLKFCMADGAFDSLMAFALIAGVACEMAYGFVGARWTRLAPIAAEALFTFALMRYISLNVGTFVNLVNGVQLFGGAVNLGLVFGLIGLLVSLMVLELLASFMTRTKDEKSEDRAQARAVREKKAERRAAKTSGSRS